MNIQKAINKVKALINLVNSIKSIVEEVLIAYNAAFLTTSVSLNNIFNKNQTLDFPTLLPVNKGGVLNPDGTIATEKFPSAINPDDPFRDVPVSQIQAEVAAQQAILISDNFETSGDLDGTTTLPGFQALANVATALAALIAQNQIESCRALATVAAQTMAAIKFGSDVLEPLGTDSDGSIELYNEIMDIKRSAILLQQAYEQGLAQNRVGVRRYTVPRLMSVRELAFENGLSPERSLEIDLLNPDIESLNFIPKNSEVLVPL